MFFVPVCLVIQEPILVPLFRMSILLGSAGVYIVFCILLSLDIKQMYTNRMTCFRQVLEELLRHPGSNGGSSHKSGRRDVMGVYVFVEFSGGLLVETIVCRSLIPSARVYGIPHTFSTC